MAGHGAPDQRPVDCHDLRVAVVAASWHEQVMDGLVDGALRALKDYQVEEPKVVRVPGAFELPVVADALARQGYDAVVALGRRDPRRHAALRVRLLRRHRRARPGSPSTTRWRSASACSPATPRSRRSTAPGLEGSRRGQGLRGDRRRAGHRPDPAHVRRVYLD